jgi:hypothetical protein
LQQKIELETAFPNQASYGVSFLFSELLICTLLEKNLKTPWSGFRALAGIEYLPSRLRDLNASRELPRTISAW